MAILILLAFSVLAWVVLILPRQRELKRHQALMGQLAVGDDVMMTSGIYGVIRDIEGEYVQLEIADGLQVRIAKRSIAARVDEPGGALGTSTDVSPSATASSDTDSAAGVPIGQTPDSESEPVRGDDGDDGNEAVIDLDDEIDTARGNEA